MKYSTATIVAAFAALAAASDVHDLKTDTFAPFMEEHKLVLAEFFAPWCGHCKNLAPHYEEAATALKEQEIPLVKVDCTEEADLCQEYGIQGYPTLKVFRGSKTNDPYDGQRKADAIISYMTKQALPAVSEVTKDTIEEFKTLDKVVLVAFHDAKDTKTNTTFTGIADVLRNKYLFGATNDAEVAKAEGVTAPGLVLYKQFDEGKAVFDGAFDTEAIEKFIKTSATPLIGEIGPETYTEYMAAGIPLAYIFSESADEREQLAKELKPVAEKHRGAINIATIDATAFGQHASNLNLEVGKWPAFAIQDTVKNQKFPFDQGEKLTAKNVGKFVDEFTSGKMVASIKSDPIPEKQDGPVTVVVAHNYQDVVMDSKKDVLLEFYAPWCGHCKSLAPKYEELGQLYAANSDKIVIAKVDATTNDVPDEIAGFPTIKLFPAGKKDAPINYTGDRSVEDLVQFIEENGSNKLGVVVEDMRESASSVAAAATEAMQHQAPAATAAAASAVKHAAEGAQKIIEAVVGTEESVDDHDEL